MFCISSPISIGSTKTLPRCNEYVALSPHHPRLRATLHEIYKIYICVCIDTAVYLDRRPLGTFPW